MNENISSLTKLCSESTYFSREEWREGLKLADVAFVECEK